MELKNKEFREHESGLFVSSDGEVFVPSSGAHKEHFTYGSLFNTGYFMVCRNRKKYSVHRLVADCFLDNPDNLPTVDHIDRDKTNNDISNLRWADHSTQMQNRGNFTRPKNNAQSKKVLQLTLDGELVKEWLSTAECGRNGFNQGTVAACCRGEMKTYKKFLWKYK